MDGLLYVRAQCSLLVSGYQLDEKEYAAIAGQTG